jgi:hypothetical protein
MSKYVPAHVRMLRQMRQLLTPDGCWIQDVLARDTTGKQVNPTSPAAVSYCLLGAELKVRYAGAFSKAAARIVEGILRDKAGLAYHQDNVAAFNDHPTRTQGQVLQFLDEVIQDQEQLCV